MPRDSGQERWCVCSVRSRVIGSYDLSPPSVVCLSHRCRGNITDVHFGQLWVSDAPHLDGWWSQLPNVNTYCPQAIYKYALG